MSYFSSFPYSTMWEKNKLDPETFDSLDYSNVWKYRNTLHVKKGQGLRNYPWALIVRRFVKEGVAAKHKAYGDDPVPLKKTFLNDPDSIGLLTIGGAMENLTELMHQTVDDFAKSRTEFKKLVNDVAKLHNVIEPKLSKVLKSIRDKRMSITSELNQSLKTMKDVRSFFLDSNHKEELKRLEEFAEVGERLRVLIDNGTLDAIVEAMIKLECGRELYEQKERQGSEGKKETNLEKG